MEEEAREIFLEDYQAKGGDVEAMLALPKKKVNPLEQLGISDRSLLNPKVATQEEKV